MENDLRFRLATNMGTHLPFPPFAKSAKDGAPEHWLPGERKDRTLMGFRPVSINPRTLVRTWGTSSELM